jgi:hypothetical protein
MANYNKKYPKFHFFLNVGGFGVYGRRSLATADQRLGGQRVLFCWIGRFLSLETTRHAVANSYHMAA